MGVLSSWLRKMLKVTSKKIDEWDKRDVRRAINHFKAEIDNGKITENSFEEVKKTLKKFFKWLEKEELVNLFSLGNAYPKVSLRI